MSLYSLWPSINFVSQLASVSACSWAGPDLTPLAEQRQQTVVKALMKSREKVRALIRTGGKEGALVEIRNLAEKGYGVDLFKEAGMVSEAILAKDHITQEAVDKANEMIEESNIEDQIRDLPPQPLALLEAI